MISRRNLLLGFLTMAAWPRTTMAQQNSDPNNQDRTDMRVRFSFGVRTMTAALYDSPSARDFYSMLPLDLTIQDYAHNEKIAYLPRKLVEDGHGPFDNEQPYDLCYFMPWGNLAMFYADYVHPGLIRLGRFDQGHEALHIPGEFALHIEAV